jgi:magnesium-protoporphyrin O-methyltransferase
VAGCCTQSEYRRFFNRRVAAKDARRYRKRGLTGTARTLTELAGDVRGSTVLDVGAYEDEAEALLAERGFGERAERRIGDFVADGASIEQHDVVVLHRVVCCYPDVDALVGEAADHTRRTLLLTYPQDRGLIRAGVRVANIVLHVFRCGFRTYAHRVETIVAVAAQHGLTLETRRPAGVLWESAVLSRGASRAAD